MILALPGGSSSLRRDIRRIRKVNTGVSRSELQSTTLSSPPQSEAKTKQNTQVATSGRQGET